MASVREDVGDAKASRLFPRSVAAGLALTGVVLAFGWKAYGDMLPTLPVLASAREPGSPVTANASTATNELRILQQQFAGSFGSIGQALTVQQSELKRLSGEIAALTTKLGLLEQVPRLAAADPLPPPKPLAQAPRKKPPLPGTAETIAVGGAPLPRAAQIR